MRFNENTCIEIVKSVFPVKVNPKKPCVGMLFNDEEELYTFYTNYAR